MENIEDLKIELDNWLEENQEELELHPSEVANILKGVYQEDKELFLDYIEKIENRHIGEIILELPEKLKSEAIEYLSPQDLSEAANNLESDDATDLVQEIEWLHENKVEEVLSLINSENRDEINKLLKYEDDQAGAWMQTEFFYAFEDETISDAIKRLKAFKESGSLHEVYQLFIVSENFNILTSVRIDDLLTYELNQKLKELLDDVEQKNISVKATDDIKVVSRIFEEYNLQVIPVIDDNGKMIGRITSDDAYDMISEIATEQVYNMAGVDDDVETEDNLQEIIKTRAYWLFLNLLTAVLASMVIGLFDSTLQALIPLAILMPIVASMGGNAGTQTLTVVVRQLALGEIDSGDGRRAIKREVIISLFNGVIFAIAASIIAFVWFDQIMLGVVIAIAMVINLFVAGFFGSTIPLLLRKFGVDPAIGSTVLLTTATDIFGFFAFLGLAKVMLL
jgi:magnesium transporter